MKFFLPIILLLLLSVTHPVQSSAEKDVVERSTSLGTGLPTTNERYKREELIPKPTKKEATNYDFVEEEEDSPEVDTDMTNSNDELATSTDTNNSSSTGEDYSKHTGTDYFQSNSDSDEKKNNKTAHSKTTNSPQANANESAQSELNTLPQTGTEENNWPLYGGIILVLGIIILIYISRRRN